MVHTAASRSAKFSKSQAIIFGWKQMRKNFLFFLVVLLVVTAVNMVPGIISGLFERRDGALLGFLATLIGWGLQLAVSLGLIGIALKIYDKKKVAYRDIFSYFHLIIPYFFASILYGLIVVAGFILFVIPAVVWAIKFRYYTYFMVDKNFGPIRALKASARVTNGVKWNLFLLGLLLGLINILGALAFLVGLFATIPLSMMAEAYVFRKLSDK